MKLTWSELKIPPINLCNFPSWEVQLTKGKKMKTITLTKDELEAFVFIYNDALLKEYLFYSESGKLQKDSYASLFIKLGINLRIGEKDV
jgi:hypothetical protein